jgi:pimeloyl-ACP methyl ester carboxylesterase
LVRRLARSRHARLEPRARGGRGRAPTLLIQGAEDEYASLAHLDRIEGHVRGPVRRLVVPGGHSPHLEQAEAVVEAIAAFVRGLP